MKNREESQFAEKKRRRRLRISEQEHAKIQYSSDTVLEFSQEGNVISFHSTNCNRLQIYSIYTACDEDENSDDKLTAETEKQLTKQLLTNYS